MVRTKRWKGMVVGLLLILLVTGPALAYDGEFSDPDSHPLRLVAYALHPAGCAIEWLVIRPIHAVLSQPQLEHFFGHSPHEANFSCGSTPAAAAPPPAVVATPTVAVAPPLVVIPPAPVTPEVVPPPLSPEEIAALKKAAEEAKQAAEEAKQAAQAAEAAAQKTGRTFEKTLRK